MSTTARRLARRLRRLGLQLRRRAARVGAAWRSSMQLRVISTALLIGLTTVALLSAFLASTIRDGLLEQRVQQLLAESTRSTAQAQATLNSATATSTAQVQQLLNDMLPALQVSGPGGREVFLLRSSSNGVPSSVLDITTAPQLRSLISADLRASTVEEDGQRWQAVAIPVDADDDARADVVPGVMVGSTVEVPVSGTFELYYLYSLQSEEETLAFMQQVLAIAGVVLVGFLGVITWMVTRQAVKPVQRAAEVAERLADGHLDERLVVRGEDEMATLARSFNEMAESLQDQIQRLDQLSTVQRRFVSDVSHELRTPLTTVRMASEMIYEGRDDFEPVVKRSAELLVNQLDRFEDLLADLLEISRFDAGAAVLDAESRDLRDVVNSAIDQAMPLAERKGVWLTGDFDDTSASADIDPRRVERVVRNLLVNAIEHAEGGPVEVRVTADDKAVAVRVRDHGVGLARDEVGHVFDRFWRADPARARTSGGTGLGLAISLEDALLHGGWLEAWGRPGMGASFRLTLPRRAGIVLTASPIDLVPPRAADEPSTAPLHHEEVGPASLPTLEDLSAHPVGQQPVTEHAGSDEQSRPEHGRAEPHRPDQHGDQGAQVEVR